MGDDLGFLVLTLGVISLMGLVTASRLSRPLKWILVAGLALRVLGAISRHYVLFSFYDGFGDARPYFNGSADYLSLSMAGNLSWVIDPAYWVRGTWLGTQFVYIPTTMVRAIVGPSLLGAFVAFSLMAFVGLLSFASAARHPSVDISDWRYTGFLLLFPSLWYWPSSVGKEALIMLGLGVATAGFAARGRGINWHLLVPGLLLVFAVRPQVAAVLACAMVLSLGTPWTREGGSAGHLLRTAGMLVVGVMIVAWAGRSLGVEDYGLDGLTQYVTESGSRAVQGGTSVELVPATPAGVPVAIGNILFRPFPWEATNPMVLLSSVEILGFWLLALARGRSLSAAIGSWRQCRMVRLAVIFTLLYSLALGMMVVNVGIVARQRVFLFPFLFFLLSFRERRTASVPGTSGFQAPGVYRRVASVHQG